MTRPRILNKYTDSQFTYHVFGRTFNVFDYISETNEDFNSNLYHNTKRHICHHAKHRKREPGGVHGQLEGCNRNLLPRAAVENVFHGKGGPFVPYTDSLYSMCK